MLDNFITTDNPRLFSGFVVFDADGVFADVFEPDVFECAVAIAMNAFGLVLADDGVFQGGAGFEEEYGVCFAFWVAR